MNPGDVDYDPKYDHFIGMASDGVIVVLADTEEKLLLYLNAHPNPKTW